MPKEKAVFVWVEFLHDHDVPGARNYAVAPRQVVACVEIRLHFKAGERAELRDWFAERMVSEGHARYVVEPAA